MTATDLCAEFEGFRARAYRCPAGVMTIGYGSTRDADGLPIKPGASITPAVARDLLARDLAEAEAAVKLYVRRDLTDGQRAALLSLIYNIGTAAFSRSTLLRKLNAGDLVGAANEFPKWVRGGGQVLPGLVRRREAERAAFLS